MNFNKLKLMNFNNTNNKTFQFFLIIIFIFAFKSNSLFAKGYGKGGCGAGATTSQGSSINNNISQTIVVSSNNPYASYPYPLINVSLLPYNTQVWAISSGTSMCDAKDDVAEHKIRKEKFVAVNYSFLQTEMSAGKGENIKALSLLMGCSDTNSFSNMVKNNYDYFFNKSKSDPKIFINRLNEKIKKDEVLSNNCKV